jgi:hypothetical protein
MLLFGGIDTSEGVMGGLWSINIQDRYREEDIWEELPLRAGAPTGLCRHTAVVYENSMYVYGGYDDSSNSNATTFVLDIPSLAWTLIGPEGELPPALDSHSAVLYSDGSATWMYTFGGFDLGSRSNSVYALNLTTRRWRVVSTSGQAPKPRSSHSTVVYEHDMYVFGGTNNDSVKLDDLWRLDLTTSAWTLVQVTGCVPSPRSGHTATLTMGLMLVFAGSVDSTIETNDMFVFNFTTKAWAQIQFEHVIQDPVSASQIEELKKSKLPKKKGSPEVVRKSVPSSEEASPEGRVVKVAVFDGPPSPLVGKVGGKVPHPRDGHSALICKSSMIVFGGDRYQMPFNDLYCYSLVEDTLKTPLN